jgi:HD-GYP domain-containing protein (c-di-GMP phosphodiesterase class II)
VSAGTGQIALSEVIGGLSYALDLTEGEPPGHAVRSCLIGMRLAEEIGLDAELRSHLFYALLLKDAGCSANSARMAALFGADDHRAKRTSKRVDWSGAFPAFVWALRTVAPGGSARRRIDRLLAIRAEGEVTRALMQARCDRGAEIAYLLGFEEPTAEAIRALDEHWDGRGQPHGLRGEEIPLLGRILCLAQTAEIFHAAGGVRAAWHMAQRRRGGWFDPDLVDALGAFRFDVPFWWSLRDDDIAPWEPADRLLMADEARLDAIAYAFAGVIDAKSPWTYRHSDRTCVIVLGLAAALGADEDELSDLRRAALLHDIGKLAVSNRILDKPGSLTAEEFAQIRHHPVVTHQILERVPGFGPLAPVAAAHHERLDGSGYPDGLTADELTMPMRLLAVADVYEALTSARPYRAAMRSEQALAIIRRESPQALDDEAASALAGLVHDPGAPPGGGHVGDPEDDAARGEEVLDRRGAGLVGEDA